MSLATSVFDDEHLVSYAGLVPVMALAEQAGLSELVDKRVEVASTRVASAGVNTVGKLTSIVAGMAAGADSIDDLQVIRSGGMKQMFLGSGRGREDARLARGRNVASGQPEVGEVDPLSVGAHVAEVSVHLQQLTAAQECHDLRELPLDHLDLAGRVFPKPAGHGMRAVFAEQHEAG